MATIQKGRIFISYRRNDSAGYAGRIYDHLTKHFGKTAIFMDVDTIEAGLDFVDVLQNAVQSCDVLVALIGKQWLSIKSEDGKRRLDSPEDFVRIEIAAALDRDIRVIPVLVDGAQMPYSTELPDNLRILARRNAVQINHHSFNADVYHLILQLKLALKAAEEKRRKEPDSLKHKVENEKMKFSFERYGRIWLKKITDFFSHHVKSQYPRKIDIKKHDSRSNLKLYGIILGVTLIAISVLLGINFLIQTPYVFSSPHLRSTWTSPRDRMTMVYIPAGEFTMGSNTGEPNEEPKSRINIKAFWIDQTEVTNGMYAKCVKDKSCNPPSRINSATRDSYYGNAKFNDYPVIYVSWNDAYSYCSWVGQRLPTEVEWEKAARGSEGYIYPWGNAAPDTSSLNYTLNKSSYLDYNNEIGDTQKVGMYPDGKNYYNVFDMAGNVWEWVVDKYQLTSNRTIDISSSRPSFGDGILRGGSWSDDAYHVRSSYRNHIPPVNTNNNVGFRCVKDVFE